MRFSDGYETRRHPSGRIAVYKDDIFLELAATGINANDIINADKANRETIRKHREDKDEGNIS